MGDKIYFIRKKGGQMWEIFNPNDPETLSFTFDKKKIYYTYRDVPYNLTPEQLEIFKRENETMRDFFLERIASYEAKQKNNNKQQETPTNSK